MTNGRKSPQGAKNWLNAWGDYLLQQGTQFAKEAYRHSIFDPRLFRITEEETALDVPRGQREVPPAMEGTPAFLTPEKMRRQQELGFRATEILGRQPDVKGGQELLAEGRSPFRATPPELPRSKLGEPIVPPSEVSRIVALDVGIGLAALFAPSAAAGWAATSRLPLAGKIAARGLLSPFYALEKTPGAMAGVLKDTVGYVSNKLFGQELPSAALNKVAQLAASKVGKTKSTDEAINEALNTAFKRGFLKPDKSLLTPKPEDVARGVIAPRTGQFLEGRVYMVEPQDTLAPSFYTNNPMVAARYAAGDAEGRLAGKELAQAVKQQGTKLKGATLQARNPYVTAEDDGYLRSIYQRAYNKVLKSGGDKRQAEIVGSEAVPNVLKRRGYDALVIRKESYLEVTPLSEGAIRTGKQDTLEQFSARFKNWLQEFRKVERRVDKEEMSFDKGMPVAPEQAKALDWEEFSKARGYSKEAIENFRRHLQLVEEGQKTFGLTLDDVAGISAEEAGTIPRISFSKASIQELFGRSYQGVKAIDNFSVDNMIKGISEQAGTRASEGVRRFYFKGITTGDVKRKGETVTLEALDILEGNLKAMQKAIKSSPTLRKRFTIEIKGSDASIKLNTSKLSFDDATNLWDTLLEEVIPQGGLGNKLAESVRPIVDKITGLLRLNKKAIPELAGARAQARRQIAAKMHYALKNYKGEEAFRRAYKARAQELPKGEFADISKEFTPNEMHLLSEHLRTTPALATRNVHQRTNSTIALTKLLTGQQLQRNEILLLERVFGRELAELALSTRVGLGGKVWNEILNIINVPKAVKSSMDLSAPFRQGALLFWRHPKESVSSMIPMLKSFKSDEYFLQLDDALKIRQYFSLGDDANLYLADIQSKVLPVTALEEEYMTSYAAFVPLVRRSERAFVAYLNKTRADVFDTIVGKWEKSGMDVYGKDFWQVKELSKLINYATGRGSLPSSLQGASSILNAMFFSPRLIMSRFQFPMMLLSKSPAVRRLAAQELASFVGANTAILSLLVTAGIATTERNPLSSDFEKIRIGNTRIDFWAGFQPIVRLMAQLATGHRKTKTGRYQEINRWETLLRFGETKGAPVAGLVKNFLAGESFLGEKIEDTEDVLRELTELIIPLSIDDTTEAMVQEGLIGGVYALPGLIGGGVESYDSAQQIAREVFYNMTLYQEKHLKLRELIEDGDDDKARKFIEKNQDAQFVYDSSRKQVFSNTYRMLSKYASQLEELEEALERVDEVYPPQAETPLEYIKQGVQKAAQFLEEKVTRKEIVTDEEQRQRQKEKDILEITRYIKQLSAEALMELDKIQLRQTIEAQQRSGK